jgi:predicted GNAT superfamily acetyltransferase
MNDSGMTAENPAGAGILVHEIEVRSRHADGMALRLTLRELESADDYARCEALQRATWGQGFAEVASAPMMKITQKVGGLAAGAFDDRGELLGCLFGISGLRRDRSGRSRRAHWSHIMAVRDESRGLGIGRQLKLFQRDFLLGLEVEAAYWTYDPLVARNAHLNLDRLGAEPIEYARDFYGPGDENELHRGIGTDRFLVEWRLRDPRVERALRDELPQPESWRQAPIVNADGGGRPLEDDFELPDVDVVRVEVPADVHAVKRDQPRTAVLWRRATRHALQGYMARGYRVRGLVRDGGRCGYALERRPGEDRR